MKPTAELLDQLLQDPRFKTWALGEAPEYDPYWKDWEGNDPLRTEILYQARLVMLAFQGAPEEISEEEVVQKIEVALYKAALEDPAANPLTPAAGPFPRISRRWMSIAASVLLLVTVSLSTYFIVGRQAGKSRFVPPLASTGKPDQTRTAHNTTQLPLYVQLPDGSSVVLQPNSEITFPEVFSTNQRMVTLSGEAFFEVKKNKNAPFFVHTGEVVTRVLGTSFRVKAYPGDRSIQVAVKTGEVSVFREKPAGPASLAADTETITLRPNEQIVLLKKENPVKTEPEPRVPAKALPIERLSFHYKSTPLRNVLDDLQLAYGVRIIYDGETIKNCSVTALLSDEPLLQKIQWISAIFGATYTFENNQIFFNARPCNLKQPKTNPDAYDKI